MHVLFEYSVKVTDPVGATDVVSLNVAVSPTVAVVPALIDVGIGAASSIAGDPGLTTSSSLVAPHTRP